MEGQTGYLGLIALPITFMILKHIFYIYDFYSKFIKKYILIVIILSLITGLILRYLEYDVLLIITLVGISISASIINSILFKKGSSVTETPVSFQNIWRILCIILGIICVLIPYSPLKTSFGFGKNIMVDIVSIIMWTLCGLSYIFLNRIVKN